MARLSPPVRSTIDARVRHSGKALVQLVLYMCLRAVGFAVTALLITWGLLVFFFVAIGGFSFDGMMHQLNNLTNRYVVADAVRLASFKQVVLAAHLLLLGAVTFFRRHALLPRTTIEGDQHHG